VVIQAKSNHVLNQTAQLVGVHHLKFEKLVNGVWVTLQHADNGSWGHTTSASNEFTGYISVDASGTGYQAGTPYIKQYEIVFPGARVYAAYQQTGVLFSAAFRDAYPPFEAGFKHRITVKTFTATNYTYALSSVGCAVTFTLLGE
jgi:hypothetical protein